MAQQTIHKPTNNILIVSLAVLVVVITLLALAFWAYRQYATHRMQYPVSTTNVSDLTASYSVTFQNATISLRNVPGAELTSYDDQQNTSARKDDSCPAYNKADLLKDNAVLLQLYFYDPTCSELETSSINGSTAMPRSNNDTNEDRSLVKRFRTNIGEATLYMQKETYCTNRCTSSMVPYVFIDVSKSSGKTPRAILLTGDSAEAVASTMSIQK